MAGAVPVVVYWLFLRRRFVSYGPRFCLKSNLFTYGEGGLQWAGKIKTIARICTSRPTKN